MCALADPSAFFDTQLSSTQQDVKPANPAKDKEGFFNYSDEDNQLPKGKKLFDKEKNIWYYD